MSAVDVRSVARLSHPASPVAAVNSFVLRAVPEVSARTLGAYRILFCLLFLHFWLVDFAPRSLSALAAGPKYALTDIPFLVALSSSDGAQQVVYWGVATALVVLMIGLFARLAYVSFAVLFWLATLMLNTGHFMTPMLLAVAAAVPARWGDGLSLDRTLGLSTPVQGRSRLYGYPIWLMGLAIALAYAAAGFSKLVLTDGAWLWDTGVRWGFVVDRNLAVTDWGLWFVNHYWLAVLGSVFASFGQIVYLYSCFTRSVLIKTAIGGFVAIPFLIGLLLFMGLFWWPWAILVIMLYIPWQLVGRWLDRAGQTSNQAAFAGGHRVWALSAAWLLLASHAFAVLQQKEYEPFLSNYPMYALSFPMGSERERREWEQYRRHDRHYTIDALALGSDSASLSWAVRVVPLYRALGVAPPAASQYVHGAAGRVERGQPVSAGLCSGLRAVAAESQADAHSLVIAKRYIELVEGQFQLIEPEEGTWIDLANGCRYEVRPL